MRLFKLFKKELLHLVHAHESVVLMILFPLALTWVLGMALSNASTQVIDLPEMHIPLISQNEQLSEVYQEYAREMSLDFAVMSEPEAMELYNQGKNDNLVRIGSQSIELVTKTSDKRLENMLIRMYSQSFVNQVNLVNYALEQQNYAVLTQPKAELVETTGIAGRVSPRSFDYYGVTMLTLIMMYGAMQSSSLLGLEVFNRTNLRLKSSPMPMTSIFIAKVLVAVLALIVQAAIIVAFNSLVFDVDYGNLVALAAVLIPYGIFTSSMGLMVFQMASKAQAAEGLLVMIINLMLITGGAYFPIERMGPLALLLKVSPVGWINQAVFQTVLQGSSDHIPAISLRFLGLSLVMLLIAGYLFQKRGSDHVYAN